MFQGKTNSCTIQKTQTSVWAASTPCHSLAWGEELAVTYSPEKPGRASAPCLAACQQLETQRWLPEPQSNRRAAFQRCQPRGGKDRREPRVTGEGPLGRDLQAVRGRAGRLALYGAAAGRGWKGLADQGKELGFSVKPPESCSLGHHEIRLRQDLSGEWMGGGVAEAQRC